MPTFPSKPLSDAAERAAANMRRRGYRFERGESAVDGVRRIASERADAALERLRRGPDDDGDMAAAVHATRKDTKKLRSLLRLARAGLPRKTYRRETRRYREAARTLAGPRDAEVKLATLDGLRERYADEAPPAAGLRAALEGERHRLAGGEGELEQRVEEAVQAIRAGLVSIEDWSLDGSGWKLLGPGLRRSYARGRKRFAEVREEPTAEAVHEWRKRVKDLWYHLRLLRDVWPGVMEATAGEASELADLLGDHHDLSVLADDARARGASEAGEELTELLRLVERRQDELLAQALPLGRRLYAEKPDAFVARIGRYWRTWRREPV